MPRSAPNSDATVNGDGTTTVLPASTLARSSRSSTSSVRFSAALRMKRTCVSCSAVSAPSLRASSSRDSARIEFSGVRNSWLMCDRNFDFSSSARRRWSARSSSSAYSATTPRLVSCSSWLSRCRSSWRDSQLLDLQQDLLVLPADFRDGIGRAVRRQRVHDVPEQRRGDRPALCAAASCRAAPSCPRRAST